MTTRPPLRGASLSPMTLLLIALGICGALLFAAVWLIEGATRPGYSAWAHTISALSLGPSGWVQRLNFIIFGALTLGSALGWRQALAHGVGAVAYPVLKAIEGVGLIVDGVFSQDPLAGYPPGALITGPTVHGVIHVTFAIITITAIGLDWFVLARRFAGDPTWRGWGKYAVITGVLTIVFIAISGPMVLWGGLAGLFERLSTESSAPLGLLILGRLLLQARGAGWSGALGRSRV